MHWEIKFPHLSFSMEKEWCLSCSTWKVWMTPSGLSNADVFSVYMKRHFLKKCSASKSFRHNLLALYKGQRSNILLDLIDCHMLYEAKLRLGITAWKQKRLATFEKYLASLIYSEENKNDDEKDKCKRLYYNSRNIYMYEIAIIR